jgi:hypothetical protein
MYQYKSLLIGVLDFCGQNYRNINSFLHKVLYEIKEAKPVYKGHSKEPENVTIMVG